MLEINKSTLTNFIKKYHLNTQVEAVIIKINKNKMICDFILPDDSMRGKIQLTDFKYDDVELPVMETSVVLKLIGGLDENIKFNAITAGEENVVKFLQLEDESAKLKVVLQNKSLIPNVPHNVSLPKCPTVKMQLDNSTLVKMSKVIGSLNKCEKFSISADSLTNDITFNFTENTTISTTETSADDNAFSFKFDGFEDVPDIQQKEFFTNTFKNILDVNKEYDECEIDLYKIGFMHMKFSNDATSADYYLVSLNVG